MPKSTRQRTQSVEDQLPDWRLSLHPLQHNDKSMMQECQYSSENMQPSYSNIVATQISSVVKSSRITYSAFACSSGYGSTRNLLKSVCKAQRSTRACHSTVALQAATCARRSARESTTPAIMSRVTMKSILSNIDLLVLGQRCLHLTPGFTGCALARHASMTVTNLNSLH